MVKQIKYKTEVSKFTWDKTGTGFFVADITGNINVYPGNTLKPTPLCTLSGIHNNAKCESIAFHPSNEYFATGGHDSLIGFWSLDELICTGTTSANHF